MIITIDGPAGSGKSTVARKLAARLNIPYLDTGAMYRSIAFAALEDDLDFADQDALVQKARAVKLEVDCGPTHTRVSIDGRDVSELIRTMEVSTVTSAVARCGPIRDLLVEHQRHLGGELKAFVTEGRDQGSVVFPDADAKFVLEASISTRARRRYDELRADGQDVSLDDVCENLRKRDSIDAKQWESLLVSGASVVIDTTGMSIQAVIEHMLSLLTENGKLKESLT
ncbi:MAG: (d)CMP kinase [Planctomycetota bacterium]|jgi:cytidylate kinase